MAKKNKVMNAAMRAWQTRRANAKKAVVPSAGVSSLKNVKRIKSVSRAKSIKNVRRVA